MCLDDKDADGAGEQRHHGRVEDGSRSTHLSGDVGFVWKVGGRTQPLTVGRLRRPVWRLCQSPDSSFLQGGRRLEGGNRGVKKSDSVDLLTLVIKCLGGGGHELEDSKVRTFSKRPFSPGDQVNTHTLLPKVLIATATPFTTANQAPWNRLYHLGNN